MKKFQVRGVTAYSERDNWNNGFCGKAEHYVDNNFARCADTLDKLIEILKSEFSMPDVMINSCDELGRLDLQGMELEPFSYIGYNDENMADFKAGKIDLWLTCYSFRVELVEKEIDLTLHTERKYCE